MSAIRYIVIDDNPESIREINALAALFPDLHFSGSAHNYDDGLNLILETLPAIIFLEIDPEDKQSELSLKLINEMYRYMADVPRIIVTTSGHRLAYEAIKYEVFDYLVKPVSKIDFRKSVLRYQRAAGVPNTAITTQAQPAIEAEGAASSTEPVQDTSAVVVHPVAEIPLIEKAAAEKPLVICVKSYGDYRFINADDICYLQADNNSTDIHMSNGEMVTAFKTLKHFETVLNSPFVRIHNSYIVNIDYVSRIHTGNAVCYIKNTTTKLPFSKSYKENVDAILQSITNGNYLEI